MSEYPPGNNNKKERADWPDWKKRWFVELLYKDNTRSEDEERSFRGLIKEGKRFEMENREFISRGYKENLTGLTETFKDLKYRNNMEKEKRQKNETINDEIEKRVSARIDPNISDEEREKLIEEERGREAASEVAEKEEVIRNQERLEKYNEKKTFIKKEKEKFQNEWGFNDETNLDSEKVKAGDFSLIKTAKGERVENPTEKRPLVGATKKRHEESMRNSGAWTNPAGLESQEQEKTGYGEYKKFNKEDFRSSPKSPQNSTEQTIDNQSENNQEKKGIFKTLVNTIGERLTFKKTRDLWRESREKGKDKGELESNLNRKKEYADQVVSAMSSNEIDSLPCRIRELYKKKLNRIVNNEKLTPDEKENKKEELKQKILEAAKKRDIAKGKAAERLRDLKKEQKNLRIEALFEGLKSSSTWAGILLAGGAVSGVTATGAAAEAATTLAGNLGLSRLVTIPGDLYLKIKKENPEKFSEKVGEYFVEGLQKRLSDFTETDDVKEKMKVVAKTAGHGLLAAFSVYAMSRGLDRAFSSDLTGFLGEKTGISGMFDKIKGWWGSDVSEGSEVAGDSMVLKSDNETSIEKTLRETGKGDEIWKKLENIKLVPGDIDNLHNGESVPLPEIQELEVEVPKGQGAIKTFELLKKQLEEQYTALGERPAFVKQILDADAEELAKKFGFYDPNSPAESALLHYGDSFKISDNGLEYVKANRETVLLEKNDLSGKAEGYFGKEGGKMFDSNHHDLASEGFYPDAQGEGLANNLGGTKLEAAASIELSPEQILRFSDGVNIGEVVGHANKLVEGGKIDRYSFNRLVQAFGEVFDINELLSKAQRGEDLEMTVSQLRHIMNEAFDIRVTDQEITNAFSEKKVNLSAESINNLIDIYADDNRNFTKGDFLREVFGDDGQAVTSEVNSAGRTELVTPEQKVPETPSKTWTEGDKYILQKEARELVDKITSLERDMILDSESDVSGEISQKIERARQDLATYILTNPWAFDNDTIEKFGLKEYLDVKLSLPEGVSEFIDRTSSFNKLDIEKLAEIFNEKFKDVSLREVDGEIVIGPSNSTIIADPDPHAPMRKTFNIFQKNGLLKIKGTDFSALRGVSDISKGVEYNSQNLKLFLNYAVNSIREAYQR